MDVPDNNGKAAISEKAQEIEVWGIKLPMPPWALACLAFLVIVGVALTIFYTVVLPHLTPAVTPATLDQLQESSKHAGETPAKQETVFADQKTTLIIDYFESDGCLLVIRTWTDSTRQPVKIFFRDLSNISLPSAPGATSGGRLSGQHLPENGPVIANSELSAALPILPASIGGYDLENKLLGFASSSFRASHNASDATVPQVQCGGRCSNPHDGPFNWWYGERNGDWIQVWRHWADGCTHYQWYNQRFGYYDPQIYWTCCVH